MLRDEDFAGAEADVLRYNRMSISDNGIILLMARKAAADYLEMAQGQVGNRARQHLLAAAELYRQESETMGAAHDAMPWGNIQDDELRRRLERPNRQHLAEVILQCKACQFDSTS